MADLVQQKNQSIQRPARVEDYLKELNKITSNLRVLGLEILYLTILNLGLTVVIASHLHFVSIGSINAVLFLLWAVAIVTGITILLAAFHDAIRRRGEALFEEISEELQWRQRSISLASAAKTQVLSLTEDTDRPTLEARIVLRSFTYASDLPLVPGRLGPAIYVGLNILILFIGWFVRG